MTVSEGLAAWGLASRRQAVRSPSPQLLLPQLIDARCSFPLKSMSADFHPEHTGGRPARQPLVPREKHAVADVIGRAPANANVEPDVTRLSVSADDSAGRRRHRVGR